MFDNDESDMDLLVGIVVFIMFISFIVWMAMAENARYTEDCKRFGQDYSYEGGRVPVCVNSNGESRFLKR